MCSSDDFLNWSDIDLDEVLGEYTDDDVFTTDSTESDNSDLDKTETGTTTTQLELDVDAAVSEPPNTVARSKAVRRPYIYCCPVCSKELRSPSGLRGHVIKQHPTFKRDYFKGILYYYINYTFVPH